jgi:NADPH:quinone reductase-like Zn-dependent oxidoreductase
MQAAVMTRYGDASAMELRDVPVPTPGDRQVLVRVRAAGLNPIDYKVRQGAMRLVTHLDLPRVAGSELAGLVEGIGAGVTRFAVGDRVFARVDKQELGAFATYAVVDETVLARMPRTLDFTDAAGLPLAGLTALQSLRDELGVRAGDRVFISGGAGGVGTLAIQLAVWLGAEVATTASPRGEELVRSLGATTVVNYEQQKVKDVLSDYDAAFDTTGSEPRDIFSILKPGGGFVTVGGVPEPRSATDLGASRLVAAAFWVMSAGMRRQAGRRGIDYRFLFMHPDGSELGELADLVDKGELKPVTDRVFPLDQIADAFAYLEQGRAKGKVVVRM